MSIYYTKYSDYHGSEYLCKVREDIAKPNATISDLELITCAKTLDSEIYGFTSQNITKDIPNVKCSNFQQPIKSLPVELNTVLAKGTVKTIEAEKELFDCILLNNNTLIIKETTLFIENYLKKRIIVIKQILLQMARLYRLE